MSSVGFNRLSVISADQQNYIAQQDDAQFFSVAQEYNERKTKFVNIRFLEGMNMLHNFNIKRNPRDPKISQAKEQKTRKTRNDKQGREFTCGGCKLSYLSYPALYTHIKTKHDGITPQGTIRGKNNNNKRRGRPKNLRAQPNLHHRPQPEFTFPKEYCKLLDKYQLTFTEVDEQDREQNQEEPLKLDSQYFEQQIRQLKNSSAPLITLPIVKIIAIFLYNVNEAVGARKDVMMTVGQVSERFIKFVNSNFRKILNQFQLISNYFIRKDIPENQVYCQYEKCQYLPVFISWFFKRLDADNDQMEVDYLTDFAQWLYSKKLTHIRLAKPETLEAGNTINQ